MTNNELFSLRESNPNKFWGEIANILLEEYKSDNFRNALEVPKKDAINAFRNKSVEGVSMPYHIGCTINESDLQFQYFVQFIAQNEFQRDCAPTTIISGVRYLSNDSYYIFNIDDSLCRIDVFVLHMIDQYARRSYRLDSDIELPNTYNKFNNKAFDNLFKFVGKFFARNKINRLEQGKEAYSIEEQKENKSKDWMYCLWMDGLTYCESFNPSSSEYPRLILHKTFVPYWNDASVTDDTCICEDQLKAITPKLNVLFKKAKDCFPLQYDDKDLSSAILMMWCNLIGKSIDESSISHIQDNVIRILQYYEKKGVINIDWNVVPKFTYKEINDAKNKLENFSSLVLNDADIAQYILRISACLWWHNRDFEIWYNESGKLKNLSNESGLMGILLMRGSSVKNAILYESNLLKTICSKLNKTMSNK